MKENEKFMRQALDLARKFNPSPNPRVGAVLVREGKIISKGVHKAFGEMHAEAEAIKKAGKKAEGSTLYVSLEPCNHFGKMPPCTEAIIKAGIKKVVFSATDPNKKSNSGSNYLKKNKVKVLGGILEKEGKKLIEDFTFYITHHASFITLKTAMTLDGKIASSSGDSKWVSGNKSRQRVHEIRALNDAVLVGVKTVIADNPELTSHGKGKNPLKIILDSNLRTPVNSKIFSEGSVLIACSEKLLKKNSAKKKLDSFSKLECVDFLFLPEKGGKIDLRKLLKELYKMKVMSLLIEGGSEINSSFIDQNLVNRVLFFISPKLIGGNSLTPYNGSGIKLMKNALKLKDIKIERIDEDILVEGYLK